MKINTRQIISMLSVSLILLIAACGSFSGSKGTNAERTNSFAETALPANTGNPGTILSEPGIVLPGYSGFVCFPKAWDTVVIVAGNYHKPLDHDGFVIEAAEAHESTSEQGAVMGPSYAFWCYNQTGRALEVRKMTVYVFNENGIPMQGFEIVPPNGSRSVSFGVNESHVLPIWPKDDKNIPEEIAVLLDAKGAQKTMFVIVGLREMMQKKWDIRERWLKGTKLSGAQRIIHPRYYLVGEAKIDAGYGSEIFLGPTDSEDAVFDLGHGEKWYEIRSLDEKNPVLHFLIKPIDRGTLKNLAIKKVMPRE